MPVKEESKKNGLLDKYNPNENPIIIKCKSFATQPIDRLIEFQGNLKRLSKKNREKLVESILIKGFIAPMFVWDNKGEWTLLDGHQRIKTLLWMRENGWDIPMIPVDEIEAENEEDAKRKLLAITSQYGEFDKDGYMEFTQEIEFDNTIRLVDGEINFDKNDIDIDEDQEIEYNEKNELVIICNEQEELQDLYEEMIGRGLKCKLSTL